MADVGIKGTQDSFFGGTYDKAPTGHHFAGEAREMESNPAFEGSKP